MYIMQNILAKCRILKIFPNTEHFLSFCHMYFCSISRNLGFFASSRAQHGLSPSGNLINIHKIGKIASVGSNS